MEQQAKGQEKFDGKGEIFPNGRERADILGGEAKEETEDYRKDDEVTKEGAGQEEEGRDKEIGKDIFLFPFIKPGGDESPKLVEDKGRRKKDPRQESRLKIGEESFGNGGEDQRASLGKCLNEGAHQPFDDLFDESIGDGEGDSDDQKRMDQPLTQLFEVSGQRKLLIGHLRRIPLFWQVGFLPLAKECSVQ